MVAGIWHVGTAMLVLLAVFALRSSPSSRPSAAPVALTLDESVVWADGETDTRVIAEVEPTLAGKTGNVFFKTSLGFFMVDHKRAGPALLVKLEGQRAEAILRSPGRPGTAVIKASVGNYEARVVSVQFIRAPPDEIWLTAQPNLLGTAGAAVQVAAHLERNAGRPSRGTQVEFFAVERETGNAIGRFTNIARADANGDARATFTVNNPRYHGEVVLTARVGDVQGETTIFIGEPGRPPGATGRRK